ARAVTSSTLRPSTLITLPPSARTLRLPDGMVVQRPPLPAREERPEVGTAAPAIPAGTPQLTVRMVVNAGVVQFSLTESFSGVLHVYRNGRLITSLEAKGADMFKLAGVDTSADELHIVAVATTGEVSATPEPETWTTTTTVPPTTTTTVPPTTTTTVPPPTTTTVPPTTTTVRATPTLAVPTRVATSKPNSGRAAAGRRRTQLARRQVRAASVRPATRTSSHIILRLQQDVGLDCRDRAVMFYGEGQ
ncbi:MAG: hypothetical protein EBW96_00930, partial [Actinobacteria bacterium]|nr:hypothetical protein [Actinomycetota bacterium]